MTTMTRHPIQSDLPQAYRGEFMAHGAPVNDHLGLPTDGETALAAPIGDDLLLVSGVTDVMPAVAPVLLNGDPSMAMPARVISWNRNGAPPEMAIGFVAVVPIRVAGRVRIRSIVIRRKGQPARYTLVRRALPLAGLMSIVSADAGPEFARVSDGVAQSLLVGKSNPKRLDAALSLLDSSARSDGFVELMGVVDTGQIFLQGWSTELPVDQTQLIISHEGLSIGQFRSARIERADLGGRGQGFVGILDTGGASIELPRLRRLLFRGGEGWCALDVYDRRVQLSSTDVPAHIRDVLQRATAGAETMETLRRAGERYDGRDTVSGLKKPVRIGMDMILELPGGGLLVSGWMLDPEHHVEAVILHAGSQSAAIQSDWTRLPRPDVTSAFGQDSLFAASIDPQRHDHGFLAFVPGLSSADEAPVYFELSLGKESAAFYPLKPAKASPQRALNRIMASLDPRSAAATMAIESHIGPMVQMLEHPMPRVMEYRDFGFDESATGTGLVIGANADAEEILITLSLLALDPDTRSRPIVVSAPSGLFSKVAAEIQRLASFYELNVRLVAAEGVQDTCDALEAAVQVAKLETFVFLSAGVLPREHGWIGSMERTYRAHDGKVLVSPTIVFEDNSICFAGTWFDQDERRLVDRFLGYPRDSIRGAGPSQVMAGSIDCCIVSREAFETVGGFSRSYLSAKEKGRDFCLKLKLAGMPSLWLPEVEMIVADGEGVGTSLPWQRLTRRIDRWSFDRRWPLLMTNMRGVE